MCNEHAVKKNGITRQNRACVRNVVSEVRALAHTLGNFTQ